jgi:hypothetical protein
MLDVVAVLTTLTRGYEENRSTMTRYFVPLTSIKSTDTASIG